MNPQLEAFTLLLQAAAPAFTQPSFAIFSELICAWVLCPARRTVTAMIRIADPHGRRAHDAYHRFLRAGVWSMARLWRIGAAGMVATFYAGRDKLVLDLDDTLFHKSERKVAVAGNFRVPIRSRPPRIVYALGLNLVVLTLRVQGPWGGEPLGLPINCRLFHKGGGATHNELACEMLREVAGWFPNHRFVLCADGAFASLVADGLERTHLVSRMRRNAALYELPPPSTGRRGRPRKKGAHLASLAELAEQAPWQRAEIELRGKKTTRLVWSRPVLWYRVRPESQVLLVIARDPAGVEPDDYFFTTDLSASPAWVAGTYAGRWSIEDTFRNVKQFLGGQEPQCWKRQGPERAACLSLWVYGVVWSWYITTQGTRRSWPQLPWYRSKCMPSFVDALATLRRVLWSRTIFATSTPGQLDPKMTDTLLEALSRAA